MDSVTINTMSYHVSYHGSGFDTPPLSFDNIDVDCTGIFGGSESVKNIEPSGRNLTQRSIRIDGNVARPTFPGGNGIDPTQRAWVREGNTIYETFPGSTGHDPTRPSYIVQ